MCFTYPNDVVYLVLRFTTYVWDSLCVLVFYSVPTNKLTIYYVRVYGIKSNL